MSTTKLSERPYTAYKSAVDPNTWLVRFGTVGRVYEYLTPIQAANACDALNDAYQLGVASLEARIADLEGIGVEPFNGHSPLPWTKVRGSERDPATDEYQGVNYLKDDGGTIADFFYNDHIRDDEETEANADFVEHAVHSYYPLTSQVRQQREAMQVCADALHDEKLMRAGHRFKNNGTTKLESTAAAALSRLKELEITPKP